MKLFSYRSKTVVLIIKVVYRYLYAKMYPITCTDLYFVLLQRLRLYFLDSDLKFPQVTL